MPPGKIIQGRRKDQNQQKENLINGEKWRLMGEVNEGGFEGDLSRPQMLIIVTM